MPLLPGCGYSTLTAYGARAGGSMSPAPWLRSARASTRLAASCRRVRGPDIAAHDSSCRSACGSKVWPQLRQA